jgi:formylglycine-generating enzyme
MTTPTVWVPAGEFVMGSDDFYSDEGPPHRARVSAFELDEHPATNAEFAEFC